MRQHQLFDMGIRGGSADYGRRHVEAPLHSRGALWYRVMSNEYVRMRCQLRQSLSLSVRIPAEDDALAANVHPLGQSRKGSMDDAHRVEGHVAVAKYKNGHRSCIDIVRL